MDFLIEIWVFRVIAMIDCLQFLDNLEFIVYFKLVSFKSLFQNVALFKVCTYVVETPIFIAKECQAFANDWTHVGDLRKEMLP